MALNKNLNKVLNYTPKLHVIASFIDVHKRIPNLLKPRLFSEKVLWRALFDRRPDIAWTCDKLEMKKHAIQRCPEILVAEVLWTGENLGELVNVPLEGHWVLKHISGTGKVYYGSGPVYSESLNEIREVTNTWVAANNYSKKRSWALSKGRPGFLVERRISEQQLNDYKFHVFAGQVAFCGIDVDRFNGHKRVVLDAEGKLLPTSYGFPIPDQLPEIPTNFPEMVRLASKLSNQCDYIRIDLYSVDGEIYLGEFTPYPAMAQDYISNQEYEKIWGALWTLPSWRTVLKNRYRRK